MFILQDILSFLLRLIYKYWTRMETGCNKVTSIVKDNWILKKADEEEFFSWKWSEITIDKLPKQEEEKSSKIKKWSNFNLEKIKKAFNFLLMRSPKMKDKDSLILIRFGTLISQDNGVGNVTLAFNGFSPRFKAKGRDYFYFNALFASRYQLPFHLII